MPFTKKQKAYLSEATHRWNFKSGAVRSGKSYVDVNAVIPMRIRERIGKAGLCFIIGVSKETIERNVLQPMRERYTAALVSTINSRNIANICGEEVYCLGAEKVTQVAKIQGCSAKYIYGDEVAKWHEDVFNIIKSRLDKPYSCFDGSLNPEHPTHWLKSFIDDKNIDIYLQKYTIFDNEYLSKSFVENLCAEYKGTFYYDRLILGEWAAPQGMVYSMFDEKTHTLDTKKMSFSRHCISIDYGTVNPFSMGLWGENGGVWYRVKEFYWDSKKQRRQKTDAEYYDDLKEFAGGLKIEQIIIDPSAASFITLIRKNGEFNVKSADNNVADGIRRVGGAIAAKKLLFDKSCKASIAEFGGYRWDESGGDDKPIKENDHAMDEIRYFVNTMLKPRKQQGFIKLSNL